MSNDTGLSPRVLEAVDAWVLPDTVRAEDSESFQQYRHYIWLKIVFIIGCVIAILFAVAYAATVGAYDIGIIETYEIIWNHLQGQVTDATKDYIVIHLRLPRIVTALVAGAGLAVAGVVMQSTLLNPLADPYTTGVSSGASFGATLAITMGVTVTTGHYAIVLNAFVFSLLPTAAIITIARMRKTSPTTMIMAGIAVMYIFNACTTVMMLWADPYAMDEVYQWQVGSVSNATWDQIPIMIAVTAVGLLITQLIAGKLNVLATGDESAKALGIDAVSMRTVSLILVALVSAVIVSFTGLIGFVGLVAPHIVRMFVGPDNRYLVPASAVFGGFLLIVADVIGRIVIAPSVLQVGVITAFMGAPIFLWLIFRRNSEIWG